MLVTMRQQARLWLDHLAADLQAWQLVIVSGNDLFAAAMFWSYPGPMVRATTLADLRELLTHPEAGASQAPGPPAEGLDPAALQPLPQQILPISAAPPGSLAAAQQCLFFLLCDHLRDGEVEDALALLDHTVPRARRRLLCVLADWSEHPRLQAQLAAGAQGLCTIRSEGKGRIYTAMAVIAYGGHYLDPLFQQRLHQAGARRQRLIGPQELASRERQLLREVCRGYNSPEIAQRQGLAQGSVRRYLSHTYQRIGVRDRAQAIGWCVANGLIRPEELQQVYLATGDPAAHPGGSTTAAHTSGPKPAGKRGRGEAARNT
ncbi:MAG: response regulator transcription factor [Cyanobacteria bacterium K_Offshore_surface_m2_239]|nr:response regulator transcription factor [Cyanobacteria bacterium K_Offshore_surface_m2_239]